MVILIHQSQRHVQFSYMKRVFLVRRQQIRRYFLWASSGYLYVFLSIDTGFPVAHENKCIKSKEKLFHTTQLSIQFEWAQLFKY